MMTFEAASVSPRDLSLALGAVAGLADVVGGALVTGRRHWDRTFLQYFLALGAGFMLAVAFLRMVPESLEKGSHLYLYVLIGYFVVHLTEHTLTPHFHFGEHDALVHPAVGYSAWPGSASTRSSTGWRSPRVSW
jgi:ZIP family zinc transporter/zinc and cadmium transporter